MSKTDNLTDFLVDVADAIRAKKGSSETINPQNFSEEIKNLPSGGTEVEEKEINFYDYDGTLLFSYTIPEAQALTELPTPKGHSGLIFDGWNWGYEDVIALDYPMDIGAMYRTDDGKTRLYLEVEDEKGVDIELDFTQKANDVIVDFGDGSPTQISAAAAAIIPHHYAKGSYVLSLENSREISLNGNSNNYKSVLGLMNTEMSNCLIGANIGNNVKLDASFFGAKKLRKVSLARDTKLSGAIFSYCLSLRFFAYPTSATSTISSIASYSGIQRVAHNKSCVSLAANAYSNSSIKRITISKEVSTINISTSPFSGASLESINLGDTITKIPASLFANCTFLRSCILPNGVNEISASCFSECRQLTYVKLPDELKTIKNNGFNQCRSMEDFVFSSGLTSIEANAFYGNKARLFDFRQTMQIPTLANSSAFSGILPSCKIVVPDNLYDEWIAATNWSTYASYIIKKSDYEAL